MLKMKSAKSYKILILLFAMVMFVATALAFAPKGSALAEDGQSASVYRPDYLTVYDGEGNELSNKAEYQKIDGDNNDVISVSVEKTNVVKFKNQLVLAQGETTGDLKIVLDVPTGMELKLIVKATALDPNGNKKVVGEQTSFDKEIVSAFTLNTEELVLGLTDNIITLNGTKISDDLYYQVNAIADKVAVNVEFEVLDVATDKNLKIVSVNQFATASNAGFNADDYNQTFEINESGELTKVALPRVMLPKGAYAKTEEGYVLRKINGVGYDFNYGAVTMKAYRLTGSTILADSLKLTAKNPKNDYSVTFSVENNSKFITFNLEDNTKKEDMAFGVVWNDKELESFNVEVIPATKEGDYENKAPIVDNSASTMNLLDSYQKALEAKTIKEGTNHSIPLGKTFNIPSMDAFFLDDNASYTELTKRYYFITPTTTSNQTSTTSPKIDVAGTYKLYALASEKVGNTTLEMESKFFYDVKLDKYLLKDGDNFTEVKKYQDGTKNLTQEYQDALTENKYFVYMFTFEIQDDAQLKVIPNSQDNGFVGVLYKVEKFNVTDNTSTVYKLFYNANVNAKAGDSGWVEIINKNNIPENGANGYTYDQLTAISFDNANLTFTPDKIGAYMVKCEVTSKVQSGKSQIANVIIKVESEAVQLELPNYWFRDNLASIIFLGVGTICLIGIIVLLLIKPKEDLDLQDQTKTEKTTASKNKKNTSK